MAAFTPVNSLPEEPDPCRAARLRPWQEARLGMFIHFGPYAVLGRGEWAMQQENLTRTEVEALADQLDPAPGALRELVRLAHSAGMRYAVLTTKHCDGFHLWPTDECDFHAGNRGPRRDLVAEFVEACREFGLMVGLYYCLMDWRHPDGDLCAVDEDARRRFVETTHRKVLELMSRYGRIDLLWFDGPWPMPTPEQWESDRLMAEVRKLQPDIIVNNRLRRAEDFSTPEGSVAPQQPGRAWEACMTLNGDWGYSDTPPGDYRSLRDVLRMLRAATAGGGNLLLNVGPKADGTAPEPARALLTDLGAWLQVHGEATYGQVTRVDGILEPWTNAGFWTLRGTTGYFWLLRGDASPQFSIARLHGRVERVTVLHSGEPLAFEHTEERLTIRGVPPLSSEPTAQTPVLKVQFAETPRQQIGAGMIDLPAESCAWW